MATMIKRTENDRYTALLNIAEVQADKDMVEFLQKKIEQNKRKNSRKSDKLTPAQEQNIVIMDEIAEFLSAHKGEQFNLDTLRKSISVERTQNQMTYLLTTLYNDKRIMREIVKGKRVYRAPVEGDKWTDKGGAEF